MEVDGPDPKLLRLVQQLDKERQEKIKAKAEASTLRAQLTRLRRTIAVDSAASSPKGRLSS
jgi:hypothetical protein